MEGTCSIVAVFVEISASVPRHARDKCSSRALVFSGWSSCQCDCEKSLSRPNTTLLVILHEALEMTVRQIIKETIVV